MTGPKIGPTTKIGRNDPCPCLSGLKYKKCCGRSLPEDLPYSTEVRFRESNAEEVGSVEGQTIVKVQGALDSQDRVITTGPVMVYDRARSAPFKRYLPYSQVADFMKGRQKVFLYASIKFGQLVFSGEAPWQEW